MKILFQGDSITDGNRLKDRPSDLNHQIGHSYVYVIAGKLGAQYPQKNLQFVNRGISGNTVQDLADRWERDCLAVCPDVLSILVGVNDVHYSVFDGREFCIEKTEETLKSLIDRTRLAHAVTEIVLCEPFSLPVGEVGRRWSQWQPKLLQVQQTIRSVAAQKQVHFLPLQEMFDGLCQTAPPAYWIWDGVHPTESGHWMIARQWLQFAAENRLLCMNG